MLVCCFFSGCFPVDFSDRLLSTTVHCCFIFATTVVESFWIVLLNRCCTYMWRFERVYIVGVRIHVERVCNENTGSKYRTGSAETFCVVLGSFLYMTALCVLRSGPVVRTARHLLTFCTFLVLACSHGDTAVRIFKRCRRFEWTNNLLFDGLFVLVLQNNHLVNCMAALRALLSLQVTVVLPIFYWCSSFACIGRIFLITDCNVEPWFLLLQNNRDKVMFVPSCWCCWAYGCFFN